MYLTILSKNIIQSSVFIFDKNYKLINLVSFKIICVKKKCILSCDPSNTVKDVTDWMVDILYYVIIIHLS